MTVVGEVGARVSVRSRLRHGVGVCRLLSHPQLYTEPRPRAKPPNRAACLVPALPRFTPQEPVLHPPIRPWADSISPSPSEHSISLRSSPCANLSRPSCRLRLNLRQPSFPTRPGSASTLSPVAFFSFALRPDSGQHSTDWPVLECGTPSIPLS